MASTHVAATHRAGVYCGPWRGEEACRAQARQGAESRGVGPTPGGATPAHSTGVKSGEAKTTQPPTQNPDKGEHRLPCMCQANGANSIPARFDVILGISLTPLRLLMCKIGVTIKSILQQPFIILMSQ